MRHRRSVSYEFEKKAQKARLEAQLAELNAQLAFLNKARPKIALLRKTIRQIDAEATTEAALAHHHVEGRGRHGEPANRSREQ